MASNSAANPSGQRRRGKGPSASAGAKRGSCAASQAAPSARSSGPSMIRPMIAAMRQSPLQARDLRPTPCAMSDRIAKRNVAVLVAAQAILGAQMPMIFTYGGLAGQSLASNVCFATLPITMIVVGSMLSATPLSAVMQRYGRRAGFVTGALGGALGAAISAYGLLEQSFVLFCIGSLFTGMYMSAQGFYRFAAADTASDAFRPKAISYVMAGGLLSAVIGPQLGAATVEAMVIPFLAIYLAVIPLNLIGMLMFAFLDIPKPKLPTVWRCRRAQPDGAFENPAHCRGDDRGDGVLCADESGDDLDPACRGRLRLCQG